MRCLKPSDAATVSRQSVSSSSSGTTSATKYILTLVADFLSKEKTNCFLPTASSCKWPLVMRKRGSKLGGEL